MREINFVLEPICSLASGELVGAEALLRLPSGREKLMAPAEVQIKLLQRSFREQVLFEAVDRSMCWMTRRTCPVGYVTVNIDPVELANTSVIETLIQLIQRNGLNRRRIRFELVERFNNIDMESIHIGARAFADNEIDLFIDDFGSGFRPFDYLVSLPVSGIKIDHSIIRNCAGDPNRQALLAASSSLASSLGIEIIAEGIENIADESAVQAAGISTGQGYLYGGPVGHLQA